MTYLTMYDAIDVSQIPANPQAVAGYVGGFWPDYSTEVKKFPSAYHLSIAVSASEDADCLDIENGDAVPSQAPAWVRRQLGRGVYRPVLYASLSVMPTVVATLESSGIQRSEVRLWVAHYIYNRTNAIAEITRLHYDGEQWNDHALSRNLDESVLVSNFFAKAPAAPVVHVNPPQYAKFQTQPVTLRNGQKVTELATVAAYDAARRHPLINKGKLVKLEQTLGELAEVILLRVLSTGSVTPDWAPYYRGWRFQQLIARSQGKRLVK